MPERWERELRKLREVEMHEPAVRERIERGADVGRQLPRRDRLVAGAVAATVTIAAIAFLWQVIPDEEGLDIGGVSADLPSLLVTFTSDGTVGDGSESPPERIETSISYGDAREQSSTSTTPPGAHVDWVTVEELTPFVPGPVIGSHIDFKTDGAEPRVLIGEPADWPDFGRFRSIETLPEEPGRYVLVLEAAYPDGVARTARVVEIVSPGVLQLVVTEGKSLYAATAAAYFDGSRTEGDLSSSWFTLGDVGAQSNPAAPSFGSDAWLELASGSPMLLTSVPTQARAGLFASYADFDLNDPLPIDLLGDAPAIEGPEGRHVLAIDVTWTHGETGWGKEGTEERALFFFPVEIADAAAHEGGSAEGEPEPTPSPRTTASTSDVLRVRCGPTGTQVLTPLVEAQRDGLHVEPVDVEAHWIIGIVSDGDAFLRSSSWSGSDSVDEVFRRPVAPGDARVLCVDGPGITEADIVRLETAGARFELTDANGYFVPFTPGCDETNVSASGPAAHWDGVDPDDAAGLIRGLPGVEPTDAVDPAGYVVDFGSKRWWRIVRSGRIIAALMIGMQGGGTAHGWICRSSGITMEVELS